MKKTYSIFPISLLLIAFIVVSPAYSQDYRNLNREFKIAVNNTLEVDVKVNLGKLFIKKGRLEDIGRLNVYYDREQYDFDYFFDDKYSELYVTLDNENYIEGLRDSKDFDDTAELTINFPENRNTNLDISVKAGTMDLDLGGIPLNNLSITSWVSETTIRFDEPNPW